jgi:hypothetical protein
MEASERIRHWLSSMQAQTLLGKLARSLSRDLRRGNIRPPFLVDGHPDDAEAGIPDLVSELNVFILADRPRIQAMILAGDRNLARYLHHAFLNYCRDLVRKADIDPLRYYRKRAAEVLRQAPSIYTSLNAEGYLVFSIHAENAGGERSPEFDLGSIPLPPQLAKGLDYESACKREVLEPLAAHFWHHLMRACGNRKYWVDLRDLVNYVGCYVPMSFTTAPEDDADRPAATVSERPGIRGPEPSLSELQPLPRPDSRQILKLAATFAARLTSKDRVVFYLRCFEEMNWDEIARQSGFSGPSGPCYRCARVMDSLRAFLREWPDLSPEGENHETVELFLDGLRSVLKGSLPES